MAIFSIIWALVIASAVDSLYARIKPGTPSLIPPKYLTTTIRISLSSAERICPNIGLPAVEDGSPSSLKRHLSPVYPIL